MESMKTLRLIAISAMLALVFLQGNAQTSDRDSSAAPSTSANAPAPEKRIDINRAGADELMKVPGMKRPWADRIVRYRPYRTKQDLYDRGIVSPDVYDHIKDYIIAHRPNP
jgi:DNA uptake protein ComE-like DNA-binding protein